MVQVERLYVEVLSIEPCAMGKEQREGWKYKKIENVAQIENSLPMAQTFMGAWVYSNMYVVYTHIWGTCSW